MNKYLQIIRRRLFITFKRKYVEESAKKRKGKCNHCSCCEVKIFDGLWKCKHYDKITKKCKVFNTDKMPRICFYYPFDEKDKWDEFKSKCGFFWENKKSE